MRCDRPPAKIERCFDRAPPSHRGLFRCCSDPGRHLIVIKLARLAEHRTQGGLQSIHEIFGHNRLFSRPRAAAEERKSDAVKGVVLMWAKFD